jgi:peptide/nickel transport system substrate-binding protein
VALLTQIDLGRRDFVVGSALAMLWGLPGPLAAQPASPGAPVRGGNLSIGYPNDPHIYNGFIYENIPQYPIMHNVVSKLLWWDAKGSLVGDLAEKWAQSPDLKEITFTLRRGIRWHDGQPFSAEDVVWSLQTVQKTPLSFGRFLAPMTDVRALDANTVRVSFSNPTPASLFAYYAGSNVILPKHLYAGKDLQNNPHNTNPVGTGPFVWKQYNRDESVVLARNPNYHGVVPYLDTLTFRFTPNPSTAILQLQSGTLDVISNFRNLGVNDVLSLSRDSRFSITRINSTVVQRICFNFRPEGSAKHKWLSDVRVRRAIAHAIDRETICNKLLHGNLQLSWGPFARANPVYDPKIQAPAFDLARANALLDEAGYKRGAGGVRFTTELAYIPFFGTDASAPAIADMLGKAGIRVNLLTADYQAYLAKYWLGPNGQGDVAMALNIGITAPTGDDCRPNYHSGYQPRNNGSGVSIPEVDQLFDQGRVEADPVKQRAIYSRLQQVLSDQMVNVWLGTTTAPNIAAKKVQNLSSIGYWDVLERFNEVWISA